VNETLIKQDEWGIEVTKGVGAESIVAAHGAKPLATPISRLPEEGVSNGGD